MAQDLVGKTVEWELSGRGRGKIQEGVVVKYVEPGTTNEDALEELKEENPKLIVRPKYVRFALDTYTTPRVMVLVPVKSKRKRPIKHIYAPNAHAVIPV